MSPDFGQAARSILAGEGDSPQQLAVRAAEACDQILRHLARLLGDAGIQLLMKRSIGLASVRFPWLPTTAAPNAAVTALRVAMEQQPSESVTEAFVAVLTAFVGLLERLIGEGLVERLLEEVWPSVFPHPAKETL